MWLTIDAALERSGGDLSGAGAGAKGQFGNCALISYIWFSVGELYTADEIFSSIASEPCTESHSHNSTAPYTAVTSSLLYSRHCLHRHAGSPLCYFLMLAGLLPAHALQG